jgi:hypothetical protein
MLKIGALEGLKYNVEKTWKVEDMLGEKLRSKEFQWLCLPDPFWIIEFWFTQKKKERETFLKRHQTSFMFSKPFQAKGFLKVELQ